MGAIPDLDLAKIRRYAKSKSPAEWRDEMRTEVDVRGKTVTIVDCRAPWRDEIGPEWSRLGVARMKYDAASNEWTLYWSDSNSRWHRFALVEPGAISDILDEIELDRTGIFWG